jgi:hypothetical protein
MGRPQFVSQSERPPDEAAREGSNEYVGTIVTVNSGSKTAKTYVFGDDPYILESFSVMPQDAIGVQVQNEITIKDGPTPVGFKFGRYPEGTPLNFVGGIRIPPNADVIVQSYHEHGSSVDLRYRFQARRVP